MRADQRAHLGQRRDDSAHWPTQQRLIACDNTIEGLTRQQPHHQSNTGTRVPHVHDLLRRTEPAQANPFDRQTASVGIRYLNTHGSESCQRC